MIALDTNVLVRFLVQDDPEQAELATRVIEQLTDDARGFVSREVLIELVWVLERAYKLSRAEIAVALDGLLSATELDIEGSDEVAPALELYRNDGFGFADLMIAAAARRAGATEMVTFDRQAARLPGVHLITD
ncbi:type II toxin-antitoxin system VapC family toxin [Thalassobacter stenotrophicus]|uniref:PIN domain-containing protein n=1 Tax=Thalassobacter stenotrophicus TaxID=266809 RepID=UPI0022A9380B|nr:type II toxin-antitoxin system VapC family toxin [Thalassobacter stenotrophicus]UYP67596.1 type II toxin-antitoxin system VapC family toxin [Thalassobacter stenotrophicus]